MSCLEGSVEQDRTPTEPETPQPNENSESEQGNPIDEDEIDYSICAKREKLPSEVDQFLKAKRLIFIGETHGTAISIVDQLPVLDYIYCSQKPVVLVIEMFEEDEQHWVDRFLDGTFSFDALSSYTGFQREWGSYYDGETLYQRIMEWAKTRKVHVLASDLPRHLMDEKKIDAIEKMRGSLPDIHEKFGFWPSYYDLYREQNRHRDQKMAERIEIALSIKKDPIVIFYSGKVHTANVPALITSEVKTSDVAAVFLGPRSSTKPYSYSFDQPYQDDPARLFLGQHSESGLFNAQMNSLFSREWRRRNNENQNKK